MMTQEWSSSSDSECNEKFKAACDPKLSAIFEKSAITENIAVSYLKDPTSSASEKNARPDVSCSKVDHTEERVSFLLVERIQKALKASKGRGVAAAKETRNGGISSISRWQGRRRENAVGSPENFISKQLNEILQRNVIVEEKECSSQAKDIACTDDTFHLTHDIVIDPSKSSVDLNQLRTRHKKCKRKRKSIDSEEITRPRKYSYYDSSDEEDIAQNCRNIALTPEYILDKRDVYPWPHPKNVRYFEEMRLVQKKPGVIIIAPLDSCQPSVKKKKAKKKSADTQDTKLNGDENGIKEKSTTSPSKLVVEKKRKQTRKRGSKKKKKKKKENDEENLVGCIK